MFKKNCDSLAIVFSKSKNPTQKTILLREFGIKVSCSQQHGVMCLCRKSYRPTYVRHVFHICGTRVPYTWDDNFVSFNE